MWFLLGIPVGWFLRKMFTEKKVTVLGEMYDPNRAYSAGDVATFPSGNVLYATRNLAPGDQSSGAWASTPALTNVIGRRDR